MKLERDVIIDLLPAYFSGEASAATRALVEEYFHDNPEFEKTARGGSWPLEGLKAPLPAPDWEKEKLALERARLVMEERGSSLWLAVCFTIILFLFKVQAHRPVFIMWEDPKLGIVFSATAIMLWLMYWRSRLQKAPSRARTRFLLLASFQTALLILLSATNHKFGWFSPAPAGGGENLRFLLVAISTALWITCFYHIWKARHEKDRERE